MSNGAVYSEWVDARGRRYRVKMLGASSLRYGPCEVCGCHVSDVALQSAMGADDILFGHAACLYETRRDAGE